MFYAKLFVLIIGLAAIVVVTNQPRFKNVTTESNQLNTNAAVVTAMMEDIADMPSSKRGTAFIEKVKKAVADNQVSDKQLAALTNEYQSLL